MNLKAIGKYQALFFLLLTVLTGIIIFYPYHNVQLHLAQGDHGNNLYAFEKTMEGGMPYRDYWWVYGPLMPYFYAVFFKLFGVSIHSALLGYTLLSFLCGIVFYLAMRVFFFAEIALAATVFFWVYSTPFEHTFNHVAGILMIITAVFMVFLYIRKPEIRSLYGGLFSIFVLSLIKLNFGMAILAGFVVSVFFIDLLGKIPLSQEKKKFYAGACFAVPLAVFGIYWLFIRGLPGYVVRQCLLFMDTDPNHSTIAASLKILWDYYLPQLWRQNILGFWAAIFLSAGFLGYLWKQSRLAETQKKNLSLIFLSLSVFILIGLHEFLVSGVVYRMFWVEPLRILIIFVVIGAALMNVPKLLRWGVCLAIMAMSFNGHGIRTHYLELVRNYIPLERAKIFTTNQEPWLKTVAQATLFLKKELKPNETFLALPSDQLYYFLLDKDSPTRHTELGLRLVPEQEEEIIRAMEDNKINYVLMSNHYRAPERGLGAFGEEYGRVLAIYIRKNFKPVVIFGDWDKDPEWIGNHGVVILRRNGT